MEDSSPDETSNKELFIKSCYEVLLRRPAEANGLTTNLRKMCDGADMKRMIEGFVRCPEFSSNLRHFIHQYQPDARQLLLDSSQNGEFQYILRWLTINGSKHQMLVDVGAHGRNGSNSFDLLAHFGWKGLLIEANPYLVPGIEKEFAGLKIKLVNTAVGTSSGYAELFFGVNSAISSLVERSVAGWGPVSGKVRVPVEKLPDLLKHNLVPEDFDVMSVDIEGIDIEVFNHLIESSNYRPRFVTIELVKASEIKDLSERGFSALVRRNLQNLGPLWPEFVHRIRGSEVIGD